MSASTDLLALERPLIARGEVIVGIDEVGRGALAGPMTVGAVVLTGITTPPKGLTDSKLLSPAKRDSLVAPLEAWAADWSLGHVSAAEIDAWGLRLALAVAAGRALAGLSIVPSLALIDGSFNLLRAPEDVRFGAVAPPRLAYQDLAVTTVVKGDRTCASIAAASVLAKVCRDELMVALADEFQPYGWRQNKGYGAPEHLDAIRRWGPTVQHRHSWRLPVHEAAQNA